jgi:hypothetical protein
MVLYLIGLGLFDEQDITLRGLKAVQQCERVYLEAYTSILLCDKAKLEALYGKDVVVADRDMVESQADIILENAHQVDVAFLVVGDPFGATTHTGAPWGLAHKMQGFALFTPTVGCCQYCMCMAYTGCQALHMTHACHRQHTLATTQCHCSVSLCDTTSTSTAPNPPTTALLSWPPPPHNLCYTTHPHSPDHPPAPPPHTLCRPADPSP